MRLKWPKIYALMSGGWHRSNIRTKHFGVEDKTFVAGSYKCAPCYRELGFTEYGVFIEVTGSCTVLN